MNRAASGRSVVVVVAVLWLASGCAAPPDTPVASASQAVTLTQVSNFGSNPGALQMFTFVPPGLPSGAPLIVVLHGCTESASSYGAQTEWGNLGQRFGFATVFAQQQTANNSLSCFNWFQTGDISRDQGEALSIKQMVDHMKSTVGSDPARIFVTGISAGGLWRGPASLGTRTIFGKFGFVRRSDNHSRPSRRRYSSSISMCA